MEACETNKVRRTINLHQRIEIRNLVQFIKLAEHASISAAAEAMGMAQPSLSYSVTKLEEMLDVQLIVRSARGVELTSAGVALAEEGHRLLEMLDEVTQRIKNISCETETIRIALVPAIAQVLTVPLAETAEVEHKEVLLQVSQGMSAQIQRMIEEGRADIGCVYEFKNPADFIAQPLITEELFLVTAPDNWQGTLDASGQMFEPVPVSRLADLPLVMPSTMHGGRSSIIERLLERRGVRPKVAIQIDALPQIVEMVERASAYAILPQAAVMKQLAAGRVALVPFLDDKMTRTAYLIRKKETPISANTLSVINSLITVTEEVFARLGLAAMVHTNALTAQALPAS